MPMARAPAASLIPSGLNDFGLCQMHREVVRADVQRTCRPFDPMRSNVNVVLIVGLSRRWRSWGSTSSWVSLVISQSSSSIIQVLLIADGLQGGDHGDELRRLGIRVRGWFTNCVYANPASIQAGSASGVAPAWPASPEPSNSSAESAIGVPLRGRIGLRGCGWQPIWGFVVCAVPASGCPWASIAERRAFAVFPCTSRACAKPK